MTEFTDKQIATAIMRLGGTSHYIETIALIIKKHDRLPDFITEALNSGDGVYRP